MSDTSFSIDTSQLRVESRVVCLSPEGIALLLQRLVHTDTRAAVPLPTLRRVFQPKLEEIELLETWNEDLVDSALEGDELERALVEQAEAFDVFFNTPDDRLDVSPALLLADDGRRSEGIRLVMTEIRRRREFENTQRTQP